MDLKYITVAVVIPTYDEAGNIGRLIDRIQTEVIKKISGYYVHIVVVDGHSRDGTADIVRKCAELYARVHLIEEAEKRGIGLAYMRGFAYAMNELHADIVIEFDGDFQHPPEIIMELLNKISVGYDYVIGSRNMVGGAQSTERNVIRAFLTDFGGYLARLILFFPGKYFHMVTDPTSGLKATRVRGYLDHIDLSPGHLYSQKFGYKVQLLSETLAIGARYAEIPLTFDDRAAGVSKFEFSTVLEVLMACVKTRFNRKSFS